MEKFTVAALEGAAFAGKTTLIKHLRKNHNEDVIVIPEVGEYVGGDKNFPDVPFKTYQDAQASTYFFIELEKKRCADAFQMNKEKGLPVLMDRATPISSLLFYSLLSHIDPQNGEFLNDVYQHALEAFQAQVDAENIFIPGKLIYMRPKNKQTFLSRLSRGTKNGVFANWNSFRFLDNKYRTLVKAHFTSEGSTTTLYSENSEQNLITNTQLTLAFLRITSDPALLSNVFRNFLNENREFVLNISVNEEADFELSRNRARQLVENTKLNYE